ncbi:DUF732 domain-containing protein [Arthrobacter sp. TMN-37]
MKHSVLVALGVAALLIAGCGSDVRYDVETDYLVPGATMAAPALTDEQLNDKAFLEYVRRRHPDLQVTDGDKIITIAEAFCRMYDQGGTREDATRLIREAAGARSMYTSKELRTISGSGVAAFCPEHVNKLRQPPAQPAAHQPTPAGAVFSG